MINILIAGDFYIADNRMNQPLIDSSIRDLFVSADYRIVNLETPLTQDEPKNRILKTGPHLRSSSKTMIPYLKQLKVNLVTLANNHILDYGAEGLANTFDSLQKDEINYVGAGKNLNEASKPFSIEREGMKVAILNFTENEWSVAENNMPGANPLDVIDNVNQIKAAKSTHDKVVCIIHGGHEYYHLPSPRMVKQYRFYAENGADAIIGHHTHCIGGYDIYRDVPIIYSLGNFLFTLNSDHEEWYIGLLAQINIVKGQPVRFGILPVQQKKGSFDVSLLAGEEKERVTQQMHEICGVIANETILSQNWNSFVNQKTKQYLNSLSPTNAISNWYIRTILNRFGISRIFLNKRNLKLMLNLIRCEAHLDNVKATIKKILDRI